MLDAGDGFKANRRGKNGEGAGSLKSIEVRAAHEVVAARAAELAFLVVELVAAARTPSPWLGDGVGIGFGFALGLRIEGGLVVAHGSRINPKSQKPK
jgi:hypothetical protein